MPSKVSRATPERLRLGADFCPETAMGSALSSTIEFHSPQAEHLPAHWEVTLPHFWQIYVAFLGIALFLSRAIQLLKQLALRGAALSAGLRFRFAMSLSPKWAELLLRKARFHFFSYGYSKRS